MCAKFRFSIFSSCDDIVAEIKGGNFMPPPPAAGGWRGGPAAAGLIVSKIDPVMSYVQTKSLTFLGVGGGTPFMYVLRSVQNHEL